MTSLAMEGVLPVGLLGGETTAHTVTYPLDPCYTSVRTARDLCRRTLQTWNLPALFDDLGVVVSELVTNALRHGLGTDPTGRPRTPDWLPTSWHPSWPVEFSLTRTDSHLLCSVNDPSTDVPVRAARDSLTGLAESGRGLRLVQSLSLTWGWISLIREGVPSGKTVWALFAAPGADAGVEREKEPVGMS